MGRFSVNSIALLSILTFLSACSAVVQRSTSDNGNDSSEDAAENSNSDGTSVSVDQVDDDGSSTGFGGGVTFSGVVYSDGQMQLGDAEDCDATQVNCSTLAESWAPSWSTLEALWRMEESNWVSGAPNSVVDAINGYNGEPADGASVSSLSKVGAGTGAFDGNNDEVTVPQSFEHSQVSLSFWFNHLVGNAVLVQKALDASCGWGLRVDSNELEIFDDLNGGDAEVYSTAIVSNKWHHVVATIGASGAQSLYLNGELVGSGTATGGGVSWDNCAGTLSIGGPGDGEGGFLNGRVDELAIWTSVLDARDVRLIYSRQKASFAGSFESRIIDSRSTDSLWSQLNWVAPQPYLKELPEGEGAEDSESTDDYSGLSSNALLEDLVGAWSLNEGALSAGDPNDFAEKSGLAGAAEASGGVTPGEDGLFAGAPLIDGTAGSGIELTSVPAMGTSDRTLSIWFKSNNRATDQAIFSNYTYTCDGGTDGFYLRSNGHLGLCWRYGSVSRFFFSATNGLNDGHWHHVVLRYDRDGDLTLYIDGVLDGNSSDISGAAAENAAGTAYFLGVESDGDYPLSGKVDEVAVWNRLLSEQEVVELYQRGANRVKYQVRICSEADCSDQWAADGQGWRGPGGDHLTYLSELHSNSSVSSTCASSQECSLGEIAPGMGTQKGSASLQLDALGSQALSLSAGRYFQYRMVLESDDNNTLCDADGAGFDQDATCLPSVQSVEIGPEHSYLEE